MSEPHCTICRNFLNQCVESGTCAHDEGVKIINNENPTKLGFDELRSWLLNPFHQHSWRHGIIGYRIHVDYCTKCSRVRVRND